MKSIPLRCRFALPILAAVFPFAGSLLADDWTMFGRDATRNSVSSERDAPTDWDVKTGRNVRWRARLGTICSAQPVVSKGFVWIGTNNSGSTGDHRGGDAAVLKCFRERDGKLVYQYLSPRLRTGSLGDDFPGSVIGGSPLIQGDRLWFATNRCEAVCLDLAPLHKGASKPRVAWRVDMRAKFGVHPHTARVFVNPLCSIAGYKDWVYVVTGNAVDGTHNRIPRPDAPSLICCAKASGKVVWTDNSPGTNILHGQWASPLVVEVNGRAQVIVPQGDGWVRAFTAKGDGKGGSKLIWSFDMNRKAARWGRDRNNIVATPVFYHGRVYIASGCEQERASGPGRLCCIDPRRTGDISAELAVDAKGRRVPHRRVQAIDPKKGQRAIPNPNSGLVWEFITLGIRHIDAMHRSMSSVAIAANLLIACDDEGVVHCLDPRTGRRWWSHDTGSSIWGSPLIVDGKIYIGTEDGDLLIYRLSPKPAVATKLVASVPMDDSIYGSPAFANGILYVANYGTLYAIRKSSR